MRTVGRRIVLGVVWVLAVAALAFGSAGIVAGMAHLPGTPARAELTWAGDSAVRPSLDAAAVDLAGIADAVATLGELGRTALTAMVSRDEATLAAATDQGSVLALGIAAESSALRTRLRGLPGLGPHQELRISAAALAQHAVLVGALDATDDLSSAWARLAAGSLAAARLTALLEGHDPATAAGAEFGRSARYPEALVAIDGALVMLDDATALRDQLANTTDVAILDEWIKRNRTYDEALRHLYELLGASSGRVTPEIRTAIAAEKAARSNLPPDTRGLVVIMAEIARGGLNQAVIAIAPARGRLALALEDAPATPPP